MVVGEQHPYATRLDNLSLLSIASQWHQAGHAGAPCRSPGLDDKASAQTPGVRPHVCEAVASFLVVIWKPHPVVRHRQPELIPSEVELDQHPARPGMAQGVGERVVGYGEQETPGLNRKRWLHPVLSQLRRHRRDGSERRNVRVQGPAQIPSVEYAAHVYRVSQLPDGGLGKP